MNEDFTIIEDGEPMEPADYAYLWINGCCPLHQWCSGARPVDQVVVDYVETHVVKVVRKDVEGDGDHWSEEDLANADTLLRYLRANLGAKAEQQDGSFQDTEARTITYSQVRQAAPDLFPVSLVENDAAALAQVLMLGIDARLEACFVEARGDSCQSHPMVQIATLNDRAVGIPNCGIRPHRLAVTVSSESMPVLLRRLLEAEYGGDEELQEAAEGIAEDILRIIWKDAA